eukprot:TRINITY_DN1512_c0_g1_i1.p2 TRINITY_DN1512_c0_g1~~TRINITY_DN1512_c0_g1_i1.p2  ORF type:complete len:136 (+),score=32.28 TRINITY_DN1512_c0_g1_i1:1273-1680(+)
MVCYNCQGTGHLAKDCTGETKPRVRTERSEAPCYNCNQPGHLARDCPEPPKERRPKPEAGNGSRREPREPREPRAPRPPQEPREVKCQREFRDRDSNSTTTKGCGGPHSYNDCPLHKCAQCNDNHITSRCPFMAH